MSSEGAGSSSNNAAKPKGVVDLCNLSDSDSDDESNDSVSGKECPDPSASAPDPILKEEPGEPEPTLQCTGSSSSSTQVQDDDSQVGRVPKCAESESKSGKEKQDHGEVVDNCSDNENDSSGAADDTERNDSAQKENPGLSNIANMTEGPQAQRRNAESDDLVKKARAALMKIINYLHKQKEEPPQVLTVQFFKTFRGRELKLNNSPVSARDVGYGPGLIWDDISPLVSGTDVHEDTRTEALNNALARNHCWFKIEKLERFEERDGSMIGSFEIHFNEEMTFRHSDFADARNESDESEGEASDDEDSDDEGLDDEDSDNEGHQRSPSKKKQRRKKGPTTIIVRIIKRIARHTSQTSASRKVVYGKPLKGGRGVQIRVDDEPIPAKDVHFEAGASLDAIRALIHNCDSIDQQTNAINDILEDAGCKVRVRKVNFTKAEESEDKVFGTFRIEMPKSGSPSLRRASTEDAEDENLRPRSSRVQTKTSFYHNTEHCYGSKRKRDTDAGTSKGNLSKKTSTQGASSSSRSDANTASMSHSSVDASNQSRNDDGSKRRRRGSNASNTSQGDVTAINTNTSDTASVVTTQSNAVEEEQRQEEEEQEKEEEEQEKEEQEQEKEEVEQEQEDVARRRFKLLFQMAPKDVQLQLLKESLASIEKFG